jgi:hypothetical protein
MTAQQAIEIVIQVDDDTCLMWDAAGTLHLAYSDEELGRWAVDALRNENLPRVPPKAPSTLLRKVVALLPGDVPKAEEHTAVALVVTLARSDENDPGIVAFGAVGAPKHARGFAGAGLVLRQLGRDAAQPRVPAGPPGGMMDELVTRGGPFLAKLLES